MLTNKKACERLGIHPNTLRKWADDGKINHIRTPHGQRLYDVDGFLSRSGTRARIVYCRVSSRNQRDDLKSQIEFMRVRFPNHELIEDLGSGLNFKRKGFNSLLERILSGTVEEVVVAHKDRLMRFGFDMFQSIASRFSCKIVVLEDAQLSPSNELMQDLLSIIHVFSCRLYGLRKYSRKIKEDSDLSEKTEPTVV